jgi:hypothetical protein
MIIGDIPFGMAWKRRMPLQPDGAEAPFVTGYSENFNEAALAISMTPAKKALFRLFSVESLGQECTATRGRRFLQTCLELSD